MTICLTTSGVVLLQLFNGLGLLKIKRSVNSLNLTLQTSTCQYQQLLEKSLKFARSIRNRRQKNQHNEPCKKILAVPRRQPMGYKRRKAFISPNYRKLRWRRGSQACQILFLWKVASLIGTQNVTLYRDDGLQ